MSPYALFVSKMQADHDKNYPGEEIDFHKFSKQCAETWKAMSEEEKSKSRDIVWKPSFITRKSHNKEGHASREDNEKPCPPKRALGAFFWFCNDERPKVRASLGSESDPGRMSKELGKRWASLNSEGKAKYEDLAGKDKARYEKEAALYEAKWGASSGGDYK